MEIDIKEVIEESKINISAELETIGSSTINLLHSVEAARNEKLFSSLTEILTETFKIYISTPYLTEYSLKDGNNNIESEKQIYKNFNGYSRALAGLHLKINGLKYFKELNEGTPKHIKQRLLNANVDLSNEINQLELMKRNYNKSG